MKKTIQVGLLMFLTATALATLVGKFNGWDSLRQESPEIFIARCAATQDFLQESNKIRIVFNGTIHSEIEVVSVLKGSPQLEKTFLNSQYWPYRGEYFLVFAGCQKNQLNIGYTAIEKFRIVSLGHYFATNQIANKPLVDQVSCILNTRVKNLQEKTEQDKEEMTRLESGLK